MRNEGLVTCEARGRKGFPFFSAFFTCRPKSNPSAEVVTSKVNPPAEVVTSKLNHSAEVDRSKVNPSAEVDNPTDYAVPPRLVIIDTCGYNGEFFVAHKTEASEPGHKLRFHNLERQN